MLELAVSFPGRGEPPFEPPMSYPQDPRVMPTSVTMPSLLSKEAQPGFTESHVPGFSMSPMMFQSTGTAAAEPNHYKFQGKELDDETGLYNFGARYYSPSLGRYMSPDWSSRPVPVPFADLSNPQTLNLYSYGKNNPTTIADKDGHCPGDDCKNVKVEVTVTSPATIVENEKTNDGYITGVRANVQYTITENGKAVPNTDVHESNTNKVTLNGEPRQPKLDQQDATTNSKGQVNDTYGLVTPSDKPLTKADVNGIAETLSSNSVTQSGTQTLTFTTPTGQNCSCTVDRTLINENKDGKNNGANYQFTTSQPIVKPQQPREKQPQ